MAFYTIRPKSGTATQWSTANPVLREREIGIEYPDGGLGTGEIKMKMGDGVTAWNNIDYAILPLYIRDGQGNAVYDLSMTPQPNMLINADFRSGVIKQRYKDTPNGTAISIIGAGCAIDRWIINSLSLTAYDGYIKIQNNDSSSHSVMQELDKSFSELHTWFVNVKDCSEGCYLWATKNSDGDYAKIGDLQTGTNIFQYGGASTPFLNFSISIPSGGYIELYQCKLEKGSIYTGMPYWDKDYEYIKCSNKLMKLNRNFSGYGLGDYIYIFYDRLLEKSETPSLILDGTKSIHLFYNGKKHDYDISSREVVAGPNGYIRINGFASWNNYTLNGYFDCDLFADYETY